MPVTKSAKKALRQDQRREKINKQAKQQLKKAVAKIKKTKSAANLHEVYSLIDRAAKKGIIPKNKASRLKSQLAKKVEAPKKTKTKSKSSKSKKTSKKKG